MRGAGFALRDTRCVLRGAGCELRDSNYGLHSAGFELRNSMFDKNIDRLNVGITFVGAASSRD